MTDVKRLLEQATPLPWKEDPGPAQDPTDWVIYGPNGKWVSNLDVPVDRDYSATINTALMTRPRIGESIEANAALIVYAVNHLPDYLAVVEALERLANECQGGLSAHPDTIFEARAALARLREKVPA